jgi:GntR family transcriptional regulator / MocR family aminotransferase
VLGILLDRSLPRSLGSQLSDQLRRRIQAGELPASARLPSTRELASDLGVSRTLVLEAFEQLEAEGYIEGVRGAGSYVREGSALLAEGRAPKAGPSVDQSARPSAEPSEAALSPLGAALSPLGAALSPNEGPRAFTPGL